MSTIQPDRNYLLSKACDVAEQKLIESVKKRTLEEIAANPHLKLIDMRTRARAYWIANDVFDSEFEPFLEAFTHNPIHKKTLVVLCHDLLISRLMNDSIAVFCDNLPYKPQTKQSGVQPKYSIDSFIECKLRNMTASVRPKE